jgi:hypothetical protein
MGDEMDDRASDATAIRPISVEELGPLWDAFRKGKQVPCPRDAGPLALAVDATAHAYRMICVKCGAASPWFEATATGAIHVRSGTSSMPAPSRQGVHED